MASIESKIYTQLSNYSALTTLVTTRIYPDTRPQGDVGPAVVFQRVGGVREYHLQGYTGLENPRIQIDVYATAVDARRAIGDQVINAMESSTSYRAICAMSPVDRYEPTLKQYNRILDFSVWNKD